MYSSQLTRRCEIILKVVYWIGGPNISAAEGPGIPEERDIGFPFSLILYSIWSHYRGCSHKLVSYFGDKVLNVPYYFITGPETRIKKNMTEGINFFENSMNWWPVLNICIIRFRAKQQSFVFFFQMESLDFLLGFQFFFYLYTWVSSSLLHAFNAKQ